jgi:hypothetical protein
MAIQTFTSGQVLTAAQVNALQSNDFNQTVTTKTADYTPTTTTDIGTRLIMNSASATTITINTSIYSAGDTLFLSNIGAGVCTLTAGTCTITSAGPLAIPQYGGGLLYFTSASAAIYYPTAVTIPAASSALTFITSGSISSTSTSVDNCFSATYLNYKIVLNDLVTSAGARINMRLRVSGADNTTNAYSFAVGGIDTTSSTTSVSLAQQNTTAFKFTTDATVAAGLSTSFDLLSPFDTNATHYGPAAVWQTETVLAATSIGVFKTATSFDGVTFFPTSPDTMTGTYKIYGYANS